MALAEFDRRATALPGAGLVIPEGFALFAGGPFLEPLGRVPLLRSVVGPVASRALIAAAVAWLPLLILSIYAGVALDGADVPFLKDFHTHVRLLVALPLYIVAAQQAHIGSLVVFNQFVERGIVRDRDREKFTAILRAASGWNHSVALRLALLAFVLLYGPEVWQQKVSIHAATVWYGSGGVPGPRSFPGFWLVWVANPISWYVHTLWVVRVVFYAILLTRVAFLDLHLVATHPDRAGGLGFIGARFYGFRVLVVAEGAAVAGILANRILYEGRPLATFQIDIVAAAAIAAVLVLGPMCVFVPKLVEAKRNGYYQYGALSNEYVREFEAAWVSGRAVTAGERLLGSGDIQSLADMGNAYEVVHEMRPVPFGLQLVVQVAVLFLLPIAPLLLTTIAPQELLQKAIAAFIG